MHQNTQSVQILTFKVEDGFFYKYIESRDDIKCWVYGTSERYQKFFEGKAPKGINVYYFFIKFVNIICNSRAIHMYSNQY